VASVDALRTRIRELDAEILRAVAQRIDLVEEIRRIEREARIPPHDFEAESRLHARLRDAAEALGRDPALGDEVALFLLRRTIESQPPRAEACVEGDRLRCLVVGGEGGMGRWLCRFLNAQGHRVVVHDIAPRASVYPRADDLEAAARECDLVFVAVPMSACAHVLRRLAGARAAGIVVEICSLKAHLAPAVEEARTRGLRVVSLHPMFGPDVRLLSGKRIVLCRAGYPDDEATIRKLFEGTSARLVEIPLEDHDTMMAHVLGLAHLVNLALADTLARSGLTYETLREVAGVTFLEQAETTRVVASENPDLYYEIQAMNPSTGAAARALADSIARILAAVEARDPFRFKELMATARSWFDAAPPETDRVAEAGERPGPDAPRREET